MLLALTLQAQKMVFHLVIRKILLITCAKRMLTSRFMLVRHMDYLLFGKRFNCVVQSA